MPTQPSSKHPDETGRRERKDEGRDEGRTEARTEARAAAGEQEVAIPAEPPEGSERARDEVRADPAPRYGGGPWHVADERGEQRFGHARNDDADPSELEPEDVEPADDDAPTTDPELVAAEEAGEIEAGGLREGMRHSLKPRKSKLRN